MECSRCGRKPVTELRYSGERLCGGCFTGLFERRVKGVVRAGRLLGRGNLIAVGVSGRRDSMVLLFLLKRLFFNHPRCRLIALTLDDGDEKKLELAKRLCRKLCVEHFVVPGSGKEGALEGLSRYARSMGIDRLALGVSLDDELVYALECIMQGNVNSLLYADSCMGVKVVRPLVESPGREIALYARLNGIKYARKPKTGDRFRRALAEMLEVFERRQPGCKFKLLKSLGAVRSAL